MSGTARPEPVEGSFHQPSRRLPVLGPENGAAAALNRFVNPNLLSVQTAFVAPVEAVQSLDQSLRSHDDWLWERPIDPVSMDLSPRSHDDWPLLLMP